MVMRVFYPYLKPDGDLNALILAEAAPGWSASVSRSLFFSARHPGELVQITATLLFVPIRQQAESNRHGG